MAIELYSASLFIPLFIDFVFFFWFWCVNVICLVAAMIGNLDLWSEHLGISVNG
jgi:hypothetical protein